MNAFYNDIVSLCDRIEREWLKFNYASEDFYKVVWEATEGFDFAPLGEVANQMRLLEHPMVRAAQKRSTFSDLYFQIYNNGRFMIEILNWHGGHVNVHDHDFSGVQFQLKGDALNVVYDFEPSGGHDGALRFGQLGVREAKVWKQGGRSMVRAGDVDPHCVFHLGRPTTSMLIRTLPTARLGAQSNYFPTLAAHYGVNTDLQRKKLTGLDLLFRSSPGEFREFFTRCLDTQSLAENFFMMVKFGSRLFGPDHADLVERYAARGEKESRLVTSVIYNNGIDFLKTRINRPGHEDQDERLAVFAVAAAAGGANLARLDAQLGGALGLRRHLDAFVAKLPASDRSIAARYLELFGHPQKERAVV